MRRVSFLLFMFLSFMSTSLRTHWLDDIGQFELDSCDGQVGISSSRAVSKLKLDKKYIQDASASTPQQPLILYCHVIWKRERVNDESNITFDQ